MASFTLASLSLKDLKHLVHLQEGKVADYEWNRVDSIELDERELQQIEEVRSHLINHDTTLMNEATIWARAIYPLLLLAERDQIEAWAEVALRAKYPTFELEGLADGVLGKSVAGRLEAPYLIVVEAKKGVEAQNPVYQLYGQLLAAAHLNWEQNGRIPQEIFGCYTIGDTWKFLRAEIDAIETDQPTMRVEYSREYVEKLEAAIIFKVLKGIVDRFVALDQS